MPGLSPRMAALSQRTARHVQVPRTKRARTRFGLPQLHPGVAADVGPLDVMSDLMGDRPAWMTSTLWQAIQLEAAPFDTAFLVEILRAANRQVASASPHCASEATETQVGHFRATTDCEFHDLVFAVWLSARKARIARDTHLPEETSRAIADGASLLILANERRDPTPYVQTLRVQQAARHPGSAARRA